METIIAEKPSVARSIAAVVGATQKEDGYISGNGYAVTWAFGHLIGLANPEAYGFPAKWIAESLPMLPEQFQIHPIETKDKKSNALYSKQLKVIGNLFKKSTRIIVATDAGREGELIFRYIYGYLADKQNIRTPFVRLWISSLTDKAIREGFRLLRPGTDYDNMYQAGKSRSEADWLIGINGTRAVTLNVNDRSVWSVGRVQTPTLAMICKRYYENRQFKPTPFYMLQGLTEKNGIPFFGLLPIRFTDRPACETAKTAIEQAGSFTVAKIEKKPGYSTPPLLFDLTTIQKEANAKFGFSAEMTLNMCQALYEKKLTTYPRTGSRYIPEDVFETLPVLIRNAGHYPRFQEYVASMTGKPLGKISVNNAKVTDHHALLPTENMPKPGDINDAERKIYELIVGRMLETVSEKESKMITAATLIPENDEQYPFQVKGTIVLHPGWKAVMQGSSQQAKEKEEEENETLPDLQQGEKLTMKEIVLLEKTTKAPPLLTENSLLALMETAGKNLENEEEREALKNIGIGTPATRAEIIERLLTIKYIVRDKKNLVPTEKGLALYDVVKDMSIADVAMTGKWENALNKIADGTIPVEKFNEEIRKYTTKVVNELLHTNIRKSTPDKEQTSQFECPKCGSPFIVTDKICKYSEAEKCGFFFWRVVCQRKLTPKDIKEILENGETKGKVKLKKKDGKTFEAKLHLESDGKFTLKW